MPDIFVAPEKEEPKYNKDAFSLRKGASFNTKTGMGVRYETVAERLIKERRLGRFKAFNVMPGRVRFETQEVRERVILLLRQHWVTQIKWAAIALLMAVLPWGLNFIPVINFLPGNYQLMVIIIWYLLIIAFIYEQFISWYFHVFIITDERVIDINFINLLYKEVSEAKIDNIEDVTYTQGGVARAWFDFGDVAMQTAGEQRQFTIEAVPEPNRVVKILNELKLEEEHEKLMGRVR